MSIEQDLNRIANALEQLVAIAGGAGMKVAAPTLGGAPATTAAPVVSAAPGVVLPSTPTPPPAAPITPTAAAEALPANAEQLRALAASIAQEFGKDVKTAGKVLTFTNWVSKMLEPYGVAKLVNVAPEHIPAVSREIYAWARKEGVNV